MKKIVILGPESTGKSTLCEQLAAHYKTDWIPEYARSYLEKSGNNYQFEDLWEIAKGQMTSEDEAEKRAENGEWQAGGEIPSASDAIVPANHFLPATSHSPLTTRPLFIDTDLYVIKIWSEISFNKCDNRILTRIARSDRQLYLLCNTDLPWTADPLREYPSLDMRQKIYAYYKDAMVNQQVPWVDISGNYEERLTKAISAVDKIL